MRTVSGSRNRILLFLLGLLLLVGGLGLGLLATGAATRIPGVSTWAPGPGAALGSLLGPANPYLPVIGVITTVVAGLFASWWLLHQVPTKNRAHPYRLIDDPDHGIVTVDPSVLAQAVEDQLEITPGINSAHAELAGSARHPKLLIRLTLAPRTPVEQVLGQVYGHVVADLEKALGTPLEHVGLELDAARASAGDAKTSVRGTSVRAPASTPASLA